MRVGLLRMRLLVRQSRGLKEKRAVIKSIKEKIKSRFNVSVAEVGNLDNRQVAQLGVAFVSNDGRFAQSVLSKVLAFVRRNPIAELSDSHIEVI